MIPTKKIETNFRVPHLPGSITCIIVGQYSQRQPGKIKIQMVLKLFGFLKLSQFRGQGEMPFNHIFLQLFQTSDDVLTRTF